MFPDLEGAVAANRRFDGVRQSNVFSSNLSEPNNGRRVGDAKGSYP
jgi:hypothetical protein